MGWKLTLAFLALLGLAAMAHSRNRALVMLGLLGLGLAAAAAVLATLGLVWLGLWGSQPAGGSARLLLLVLAVPAALVSYFVIFFLRSSLRYRRGEHDHPLGMEQITRVARLLAGRGLPPHRRDDDRA